MRAQTESQTENTESRSPLLDSAALAARVSRTDMLLAGRRASDLLTSLSKGFRERFGDCRFALWLPDGADDEHETKWLSATGDAQSWWPRQPLAQRAIDERSTVQGDGSPLLLAAPLFADGGVVAALVCEIGDAESSSNVASLAQNWLADAANLLIQRLPAALELERLHLAVHRLADAERLQRALYTIADLANSELDMDDMMARIHAVIAELMYAENFYIALLDNANSDLYFPYFRDVADPDPPPPNERYPLSDYEGSLTAYVLTRGEALLGPSLDLATEHGTAGGYGPQSVDWLGVPMRHGGDVIGAVVVQSYDDTHRYDTRSLELLTFVSQHIATAIERKRAHDMLERRVRERTTELKDANRALQLEVEERQRSERLQAALFRIAELGSTSDSAESFYQAVHRVVGELLYAGNFFIALLGEGGDTIQFAYSVDEYDVDRAPRQFGAGLTEYVIRTGKPLLADRETNRRLHEAGELLSHGARATIWLGVPLICDEKTVGCLAVQSYDADHNYTSRDQELLTFVSYHIANALMRKQAADSLREANAELETRVNERTQELFSANRDLREQIGERERMERQLKHDALHDALTGLPNRAHLMNRLEDALRHFLGPAKQAFAVLFLDLDRFKVINDSVGHLIGDQLLKQVGNRIARSVEGDGLVARLGGDEFAVLLESISGQDEAESVALRIIDVLEQPVRVGGKDLYSSTSIGIVLGQSHYHTPEELLRDADVALYRAKASGRRCHVVFDETLRREALSQLELEGNLRRALARNEFDAVYQPIQSLREAQVSGYEALMRWHQADGTVMAPGEFLRIAEETGLLEAIDLQIYDRVFEQSGRLLDGGDGFVSINVGARHFRNPGFVSDMADRLQRFGLRPEQLRIEVTERTLLEDPLQVRDMLNQFDDLGVSLALDDFGTGYSSLSYLHQFPLHAIKLDRSFVSALGDDERGSAEAVLRAVCSLGHSLGMEVIAEGIETDAQRRALIALGCEFGQGFLMARPQPLGEVLAARG